MTRELGPLTLTEIAAPTAPPSGQVEVYAKTDGLVYSKDDAGTERVLSPDTAAGVEIPDLAAATLPLAGTEEVHVVQSGLSKKTTIADIRTIDVVKTLSATQANSTTTAASATALETNLEPGTYLIKVWICYRSAATTTGIQMYLDNSGGTVTRCAATWYTLTTGGAAATGIADQATTLTAQMMEGKGQRASGVASGPMQGVDTANADQFSVMEGIVIVTATAGLRFMFNSEVAGSAVTLMEGTTMTVSKVA